MEKSCISLYGCGLLDFIKNTNYPIGFREDESTEKKGLANGKRRQFHDEVERQF